MIFKKSKPLPQQSQQSGFTLITSIFLLVVVALLSGYIVSLRSVQQATLVYGVQGARAMQAARAGIEWGIFQAVPPNPISSSCLASSGSFNGSGAISNFRINVTCVPSPGHFEGSVEIETFRLTSTAETGTYGTLDYVSRRLQATISPAPP
jgi:MSHA biogenesis protein MshP